MCLKLEVDKIYHITPIDIVNEVKNNPMVYNDPKETGGGKAYNP